MNDTTLYQPGDIVEIRAEICAWHDTESDIECGCEYLAGRNGLRTTIVRVHTPTDPDAHTYYQLDGVDVLVYSDEIEAVDDIEAVQP